MVRKLILCCALSLLAVPLDCLAACHVILPNGSGTLSGADWNNACAGFTGSCSPSSMVRGDSYYLGAGSGGKYGTSGINFNTAASGSTTITIKGATAADSCTGTGFQASFDVSTAPATFTSSVTFSGPGFASGYLWAFSTPNWIIEGNTCSNPNRVYESGGQGIFIDNSAVTPTTASAESELLIGTNSAPNTVSNVRVHCADFRGAGINSTAGASHSITSISCASGTASVTTSAPTKWATGSQLSVTGVPSGNFNTNHAVITRTGHNSFTYPIACTNGTTQTSGSVDGAYSSWEKGIQIQEAGNLTFEQVTLRESANSPIQIYGGTGSWAWDHSAIVRYGNNSTNHSEAVTFQGELAGSSSSWSTATFSNGYFLDGEGTGEIVPLFGGSVSNLLVYGNVFACAQGNPNDLCDFGNAIIACINSGVVCSNVVLNNNTCVGLSTGVGWVYGDSSGTKQVSSMKNNLSFGCGAGTGGVFVISGEDHNTTLNASGVNGGTGDYVLTSGAKDPFGDHSALTPTMLSFQLSSDTLDAHLNDGVSLSAPYNIDAAGNTRGSGGVWDRGAFQFLTTQSQRPAAPTNLTAIVQ